MKQEKIERAMKLVWSSLESHMIHDRDFPKKKCCIKEVGNIQFHKKCIKEYSEILKILSELQ